jgi:hypothetical protein
VMRPLDHAARAGSSVYYFHIDYGVNVTYFWRFRPLFGKNIGDFLENRQRYSTLLFLESIFWRKF